MDVPSADQNITGRMNALTGHKITAGMSGQMTTGIPTTGMMTHRWNTGESQATDEEAKASIARAKEKVRAKANTERVKAKAKVYKGSSKGYGKG